MAQVILKNLTKRFGKVTAVNNLSLNINDKEFMVLVGPSGCGKTTVLRCIAGLEELTEGEIYIGERLVNHLEPKDRDVAMVFQNYALYPHMTVYGNLEFPLKMRRVPKEQIRQRVQGVAQMLGLSELLDRRPAQLSGGQRQRVALGRAIVRNPKVYLMDEPLSNLDAKMRVEMRAELIKLQRQLQVTTIYVTHDQVEAMTMGDRIAILKDGLLQQVDTPLNVYNHPANLFVAEFIGSPPMNRFEARIVSENGRYFAQCPAFRILLPQRHAEKLKPYEGKNVYFGIRPEHIYERRHTPIPSQDGNVVRAKVDVIEPLGAQLMVYLNDGKGSFVATLDAAVPVREEENVEMVFDVDKAHVFDLDTETALF